MQAMLTVLLEVPCKSEAILAFPIYILHQSSACEAHTKPKDHGALAVWHLCLQSGSGHLFFPHLKSLVFSSPHYYYIFEFNDIQIF